MPHDTAKGQWLEGCICPGETRAINLTLHFVNEDPACEQARFHGTMTEPNYRGADDYVVQRATVARQLGWCRCGDNDRMDELMLTYLDWLERHWVWLHAQPRNPSEWGKDDPESGLDQDVFWMLAYIADEQGWTEHGSSVVGAWITDDGKEALANLRRPEYA